MLVIQGGKLSYAQVVKTMPRAAKEARVVADYSTALRTYRMKHKLSKAAMSRLLMASQATYVGWEINNQIPGRLARAQIEKVLKSIPTSEIERKKKVVVSKRKYVSTSKVLPPKLPQVSNPASGVSDV
jgi:DNA-binding transcriptional regulator YiaG